MLSLTVQPDGRRLSFEPRMVALAGFTGRDQVSVKAHLEELEKLGVERPASWPVVYAVTPDRVTTASSIEVLHGRTSGEVEFAVLLTEGRRYIAAASDHTDRAAESLDIGLSKQAVQRVISRDVWPFEAVADHWDELTLDSYVTEAGIRRHYQHGTGGMLLPVNDILECVRKHSRAPLEEAIVFSGTVPIVEGDTRFGSRFEVELADPRLGRRLSLAYDVTVSDWLDS